jgi:hypothetical protein
MEKNKSLQTKSNAIQNEKKKTKENLQKLHLQKEKERGHDRNALYWSFFIVNDNNIIDRSKPQIMKCMMGANGITQATLTCFLTAFVTSFGEIFLKYYWNIFENFFK